MPSQLRVRLTDPTHHASREIDPTIRQQRLADPVILDKARAWVVAERPGAVDPADVCVHTVLYAGATHSWTGRSLPVATYGELYNTGATGAVPGGVA